MSQTTEKRAHLRLTLQRKAVTLSVIGCSWSTRIRGARPASHPEHHQNQQKHTNKKAPLVRNKHAPSRSVLPHIVSFRTDATELPRAEETRSVLAGAVFITAVGVARDVSGSVSASLSVVRSRNKNRPRYKTQIGLLWSFIFDCLVSKSENLEVSCLCTLLKGDEIATPSGVGAGDRYRGQASWAPCSAYRLPCVF